MPMDVKQLSAEVEHISRTYAEKFTIERDATWFVLKLQEEVGYRGIRNKMDRGVRWPHAPIHFPTIMLSAGIGS